MRGVVEVGPSAGPVRPGRGGGRSGSDGGAAADDVGCERLECSTACRRCDCRLRMEVADRTDIADARQLVAESLSDADEKNRRRRLEHDAVGSIYVASLITQKKSLVPTGQRREQAHHFHADPIPAVMVSLVGFPNAIGAQVCLRRLGTPLEHGMRRVELQVHAGRFPCKQATDPRVVDAELVAGDAPCFSLQFYPSGRDPRLQLGQFEVDTGVRVLGA